MRIAAIYDVHGNLPALEAVLQEIRRAEVDQIVVGGDVLPGPMPRETLTCLLDLDIPIQFIQGNGEREVLARMAGMETGNVPEPFREIIRWTGEQLHPEHERLLAGWPVTLRVEIRGLGEVPLNRFQGLAGSPFDSAQGRLSVLRRVNQEAGAAEACSFAPLITSHSMNAISPRSAGKTRLETLSSYCGNSKPVKLMAR